MRSSGLVVSLVLSLALPQLASAQAPGTDSGVADPIGGTPGPFTEAPIERYESPQRFAIELKFTPYTPHIDQSKGLNKGATPFADLFNKQDPIASSDPKACAAVGHPPPCYISGNKGKQPPYRLLSTVEFDYQFLHKSYGNFGVGLTTGFYRRTTHSFELDGSVACTVPYCSRSGDQTGLNILPLSALVIYRYDTLANRYHIPIVPYVKAGIAYYVWWINDGGGILSAASYPRPTATMPAKNPTSGYGGTFGFVVHPGIALQLDFLERAVAKTLDTELGINHTYLFCELNYANITDFGARNKLDLSDTMVNSGLGFEF